MAEKAGFEGEGEVEFRSPGKIRDVRDEGFQETCRTCQDSNKTPKRHARDNEICVRPFLPSFLCSPFDPLFLFPHLEF